jgi:hypothetical protein
MGKVFRVNGFCDSILKERESTFIPCKRCRKSVVRRWSLAVSSFPVVGARRPTTGSQRLTTLYCQLLRDRAVQIDRVAQLFFLDVFALGMGDVD